MTTNKRLLPLNFNVSSPLISINKEPRRSANSLTMALREIWGISLIPQISIATYSVFCAFCGFDATIKGSLGTLCI